MTTAQRLPAQTSRASDLPNPRYRIGDHSFSFAAAHHLDELSPGHKARRVHGHTYTVEVVLADTMLTGPGFVADYAELKPVGAYLKSTLDHRDLTDLFDFSTTIELLAEHLQRWCRASLAPQLGKQLHGVSVWIDPPPQPAAGVRRFTFAAAHHLDGLAEGHNCGRMHGHTYTVDVVLAGTPAGELDLTAFGAYLEQNLDYRDLSALLPFQATSELLAEHLYAWLLTGTPPAVGANLAAVRVWESPRRWAEFSSETRPV
ncbi:MAG: 6-carboxytetrahydropterin synthase [Actinobacteria bacterium]|nr:6-carboxytetrahydropterin synthase [Actinomycetota bacterium]MBI3687432.1 6-carboxytetrahydropterin synthase [Actinomycetota bacterium]